MAVAGTGIICGPGGCLRVFLPPVALGDPLVVEFARAYQEAVRAKRDPGQDPQVLRLLDLARGGAGQPKLPGF